MTGQSRSPCAEPPLRPVCHSLSMAAAGGAAAADVEERIAVCIRVRPFNDAEKAQGAFDAWKPMDDFEGHIQQHAPDGTAIGGSTYAFGESGLQSPEKPAVGLCRAVRAHADEQRWPAPTLPRRPGFRAVRGHGQHVPPGGPQDHAVGC